MQRLILTQRTLFTQKKQNKMKNKIKNLFANGQKIFDIVVSLCFEYVTLLIAFIALYGLCFSMVWATMLLQAPETLHAPATFTEYDFSTWILSCQPVETLCFWNLPIKLQGLIAVFVGCLSLNVSNFASEWLRLIVTQLPISVISKTNGGKWQPAFNTVNALMDKTVNVLCRISLYVMSTMASVAIVYFVWNILVKNCPM